MVIWGEIILFIFIYSFIFAFLVCICLFFSVCLYIHACHSVKCECVCVCVHMCTFRSEGNFSFIQVDPRDWIQVIKLGSITCLAVLMIHLIKETVEFILWQFQACLQCVLNIDATLPPRTPSICPPPALMSSFISLVTTESN